MKVVCKHETFMGYHYFVFYSFVPLYNSDRARCQEMGPGLVLRPECLCPLPPNSYVGTLMPKVMILGVGLLGGA